VKKWKGETRDRHWKHSHKIGWEGLEGLEGWEGLEGLEGWEGLEGLEGLEGFSGLGNCESWKPGGRHNDSDGGVSPSENESPDFFSFFSFPLKKSPEGDTIIAMEA